MVEGTVAGQKFNLIFSVDNLCFSVFTVCGIF